MKWIPFLLWSSIVQIFHHHAPIAAVVILVIVVLIVLANRGRKANG